MTEQEILAQANDFIRSQDLHLMTREDIPRFIDCATEAYGSICYPLDDYFVGHPCTKEEVREMWVVGARNDNNTSAMTGKGYSPAALRRSAFSAI